MDLQTIEKRGSWIVRHVDPAWGDHLDDFPPNTRVVHVVRDASVLNLQILDRLLERRSLPRPGFVDVLPIGWMHTKRGRRKWRSGGIESKDSILLRCLEKNEPALLFVRGGHQDPRKHDPIRVILRFAAQTGHRVVIIPHLMAWSPAPESQEGLISPALGEDFAARADSAIHFLFNRKDAVFRVGETIEVQEFLSRTCLPLQKNANRLRLRVVAAVERLYYNAVGPSFRSARASEREVLRSKRVQKTVTKIASKEDRPRKQVLQRTRAILRRMMARPKPWVLTLSAKLLKWIFDRVFDGIVVDSAGMKRLQEANAEGTLVLLPNHRSHFDYLVLSYIMRRYGLPVPVIAAGENLSFFPAGPLLRRGGAFFIRRKIAGNKLYSTLLATYLRQLLRSGRPVEFFVEGGRSRTGHILRPKLGLLSMTVAAARRLPKTRIFLTPIALNYDRVIEQESFVRELRGKEKEPESVGGVLRSSKLLLSKYGRLSIRVGRLIELLPESSDGKHGFRESDLSEDAAPIHWAPRPISAKAPRDRKGLTELAEGIGAEIQAAVPVTPAALLAASVLMSNTENQKISEVMRRAELILDLLHGAPRSVPSLDTDDGLENALREVIQLFFKQGFVQLESEGKRSEIIVRQEDRMRLEYYKNTISHWLLPFALRAAQMESSQGSSRPDFDKRWLYLVTKDIFFPPAAEKRIEELLPEAEKHLERHWSSADRKRLAFLFRPLFDAKIALLDFFLRNGSCKKKVFYRVLAAHATNLHLGGILLTRESNCESHMKDALRWAKDESLIETKGDDYKGVQQDKLREAIAEIRSLADPLLPSLA